MIPHSRPWITPADRAAVDRVLASEMLAQGDQTDRFEHAMAEWVGCNAPGVAVGSGAAAVHLALRGLEIGRGAEVIVPTYVCGSVVDAIRATGGRPVLCDVGPQWVATVETVAPLVSSRTKAIVVPHLYGIFADVAACRRLGVPIVEDCAQALDSARRRPIAGDIATFSFHPTKCLTTGEGGMAVTHDAALARRLRRIRDGHLGHSHRLFAPLSGLAAALGLSQLARYEVGLARRRELAARYRRLFAALAPGSVDRVPEQRTMYFRFPVSLDGGVDAHASAFAARGLQVRRGVDCLQHRVASLPDEAYPNAAAHYASTVSLPIYPALDDREMACCVNGAARVLEARLRGTRQREAS